MPIAYYKEDCLLDIEIAECITQYGLPTRVQLITKEAYLKLMLVVYGHKSVRVFFVIIMAWFNIFQRMFYSHVEYD